MIDSVICTIIGTTKLCKRLIFRYDRKIPDYFSVAGAPCYENKTRSKVLEALTSAFSKKGTVLENSMQAYLRFFADEINKNAVKLGYQISFLSESGLHVLIGRNGQKPVDIAHCSVGDKAVAIFLILDMLNGFTGIRLLLFDEVEVLDNETWRKLLTLVESRV